MTNSKPLRFLAIVEQSANFNYATSPRIRTTIEWAGAVPSRRSRQLTLAALQDRITTRLSKYLPAEGGRLLIWMLDDHGTPTLFITGLIDHRSGKLTRPKLDEWARSVLPQITCDQPMIEMTITAAATAELTFEDGSDFETADYNGDGDEYDEMIAQDMVEESCGHLDGSYVSYVEKDEDDLMVNAEITQAITVTVPWKSTTRLRPDQVEYLKVLAKDELHEYFGMVSVQFANVSVELDKAPVRTA